MRAKLDQPIRWSDGVIATPNFLLRSGKATTSVVARFQGSARGPVRQAYFVDAHDGSCVEISKIAYDSVQARKA